MFSKLLLQIKIGNAVNQIVNSVNIWMHTLKSLYLLANEETVGDVLLQVELIGAVVARCVHAAMIGRCCGTTGQMSAGLLCCQAAAWCLR